MSKKLKSHNREYIEKVYEEKINVAKLIYTKQHPKDSFSSVDYTVAS
jgi:hypothetical protein